MPNIAVVLKEEIRRLAKKEVKANTSSTKGVVAQFRRDIAKLKRLVRVQEREITFLKTQEQEKDRPVANQRRRGNGRRAAFGPICPGTA